MRHLVITVISSLIFCRLSATQETEQQYHIIDDSEDFYPYDNLSCHPILQAHLEGPEDNLQSTISESKPQEEIAEVAIELAKETFEDLGQQLAIPSIESEHTPEPVSSEQPPLQHPHIQRPPPQEPSPEQPPLQQPPPQQPPLQQPSPQQQPIQSSTSESEPQEEIEEVAIELAKETSEDLGQQLAIPSIVSEPTPEPVSSEQPPLQQPPQRQPPRQRLSLKQLSPQQPPLQQQPLQQPPLQQHPPQQPSPEQPSLQQPPPQQPSLQQPPPQQPPVSHEVIEEVVSIKMEISEDQFDLFPDVTPRMAVFSGLTILSLIGGMVYQLMFKGDDKPLVQTTNTANVTKITNSIPHPAQNVKDREIVMLEKKIKLLERKLQLAPLQTTLRKLKSKDVDSLLSESKSFLNQIRQYQYRLDENRTLKSKVVADRYERLLQIRNLQDINKIPGVIRYIDYHKRVENREMNICEMQAEDEFIREQIDLFRELVSEFEREHSSLIKEIDQVKAEGLNLERERHNVAVN